MHRERTINLKPARWIWFPSARALPNTFALFRKEFVLPARPRRATGWVSADSRYLLRVNGQRVQWGPWCCDPRRLEADPVDLSDLLRKGRNVLGAHVLYFGQGDGTYVAGKPGFIARMDLEFASGRKIRLVTNGAWKCQLDRAHRPGQHRRWYLRALQEEFDARKFPYGWDASKFSDKEWLPAMELDVAPDKPPVSGTYPDSHSDMNLDAESCRLIPRVGGPMREDSIAVKALVQQGTVEWSRDPEDWFDCRTPCFRIRERPIAAKGVRGWKLPANSSSRSGSFLIFNFAEEMSGFPYVEIAAPEGTVVELVWHEAHDPKGKHAWLDTNFHNWARFTCREGNNRFETFDHEGLRWLMLHIRNASRGVLIRKVGIRRRMYAWPNSPTVRCGSPLLQRLFTACLNTVANNAQGAIQSDSNRERQQYSSDGMGQMHVHRYAYGESRLTGRYIRTMSMGLTKSGFFLDCWPATDRMSRMPQRELGATPWGPLLDVGVCLVIDAYAHYFESGDADPLRLAYPAFRCFAEYLLALRPSNGLLPVENLGVPTVWMDHYAYKRQRHKQCAFNLLVSAMLGTALPGIAEATGHRADMARYRSAGNAIRKAVQRSFWDAREGLFVCNRRWQREEKEMRLDDLSLAFSAIYGFCPGQKVTGAIQQLSSLSPLQFVKWPSPMLPANDRKNERKKSSPRVPILGLSYPPNQRWRYEALAKHGCVDIVLGEWERIWARMPSVVENNTIAEEWHHEPDGTDQWNHNGVCPLSCLFMDIAGIRPLRPGFKSFRIRPQMGSLPSLELTCHTPHGPIHFHSEKKGSGHLIQLNSPHALHGELWLPELTLAPKGFKPLDRIRTLQLIRYRLPRASGIEVSISRDA